jgi:hypothetical protein
MSNPVAKYGTPTPQLEESVAWSGSCANGRAEGHVARDAHNERVLAFPGSGQVTPNWRDCWRGHVSAMVSLVFRSRFGAFVSAGKIPFPGNRDFGSKMRLRLHTRYLQKQIPAMQFGARPTSPGKIKKNILAAARLAVRFFCRSAINAPWGKKSARLAGSCACEHPCLPSPVLRRPGFQKSEDNRCHCCTRRPRWARWR